MSGNRNDDIEAAFNKAVKEFGLTEQPDYKKYVWHHVDDYNVTDNTCTMELVQRKVHVDSNPHSGAYAQYDEIFGGKYDHY